jgi:hypothetical protein
MVKLLQKHGLWSDADPNDDRLAQQEPLLAALATASIAGVLAVGPNAGQRPMRLFGRAAVTREEREKHQAVGNGYGFDLHAGVRAPAHDKKARERLCGYLLRPPLAKDRLTQMADGRYRIALKRAWDDGTVALVVTGQELLARLTLLVPPPRVHTTRYFRVFAPRARWRRLIVPISPPAPTSVQRRGRGTCGQAHRYRLSWTQALGKVFEVDLSICPRCGRSGMQQIAVIQDASVLRAMLAAIE